MTDIEKLKTLLDEWGVGYTEAIGVKSSRSDEKLITVEKGDALVEGYSGFYVDFHFSSEGKFKVIKILE